MVKRAEARDRNLRPRSARGRTMSTPLRLVRRKDPPPPGDARANSDKPEGISDEALVLKAQAGDRWAEDALMRRHLRDTARLVARLLGSHQDVDDIVQDTFLAAFVQMGGLRKPSAFRGWVLRIAVNKTRKVIRKRRFLRKLGLDRGGRDAELEVLADDWVDPEVRAELRIVDEVLRELPVEQRIAWMLRYVEGHTVVEVGRLCNCSESSAKRMI